MTKIILREINNCTLIQKESLLTIRNQDSVRKQMYTEHEINSYEHIKWLNSLENNNNKIVFAVLLDDNIMGAVSVQEIDKLHKKSDWALYLDEHARGGLGAALEYSLIEFVFNKLNLEKLNCEVIETNKTVARMHHKFAFTEEGFKKENIIKHNERIGVYMLGLTKADWLKNKVEIYKKYKSVLDKFEIKIEHTNEEQHHTNLV